MKKLSLLIAASMIYFGVPAYANENYIERTASRTKPAPAFRSLPFFQQPRDHHEPFQPYLDNSRESQIPQWENENWYVEDWTSQRDGMDLVNGFYKSNIIMDQKSGHSGLPILVVGPNFYHLSGLDKRRVVQTLDTVYGVTDSKQNGSFLLRDWYTNLYIGQFNQNGLQLY